MRPRTDAGGLAAGLALGLLGVCAMAACATDRFEPPAAGAVPAWTPALRAQAGALAARLRAGAPSREGTLVVRLAFPATVDLDLYVTGPALETVYYANTPARSGGRLVRDRRCGDAAGDEGTRIEEIRFDPALPGRYRVGVDYPQACTRGAGVAAFALRAETGGAPRVATGLAQRRVFQPLLMELELPSSPGPAPHPLEPRP